MAAFTVQLDSAFPVLLVSSDVHDLPVLHRILHAACQLHRAGGLREALSTARQIRPWVVICNQTFADGDWRDLLAKLQSEQQAPPLIVASRLADDHLWAEVLNLGGYDLLMKPFEEAEVDRVVKMAARRGKRTGD